MGLYIYSQSFPIVGKREWSHLEWLASYRPHSINRCVSLPWTGASTGYEARVWGFISEKGYAIGWSSHRATEEWKKAQWTAKDAAKWQLHTGEGILVFRTREPQRLECLVMRWCLAAVGGSRCWAVSGSGFQEDGRTPFFDISPFGAKQTCPEEIENEQTSCRMLGKGVFISAFHQLGLPIFWTLNGFCYWWRTSINCWHHKTPYEAQHGRMPHVQHSRVFGCRVWVVQ